MESKSNYASAFLSGQMSWHMCSLWFGCELPWKPLCTEALVRDGQWLRHWNSDPTDELIHLRILIVTGEQGTSCWRHVYKGRFTLSLSVIPLSHLFLPWCFLTAAQEQQSQGTLDGHLWNSEPQQMLPQIVFLRNPIAEINGSLTRVDFWVLSMKQKSGRCWAPCGIKACCYLLIPNPLHFGF